MISMVVMLNMAIKLKRSPYSYRYGKVSPSGIFTGKAHTFPDFRFWVLFANTKK
jgi:hypothetical protein